MNEAIQIAVDDERQRLEKIIEDESSDKEMKELVDTYLNQQQDLVEFEKELKKHKDELTPNIKGES